jgi:hypothetical protein
LLGLRFDPLSSLSSARCDTGLSPGDRHPLHGGPVRLGIHPATPAFKPRQPQDSKSQPRGARLGDVSCSGPEQAMLSALDEGTLEPSAIRRIERIAVEGIGA